VKRQGIFSEKKGGILRIAFFLFIIIIIVAVIGIVKLKFMVGEQLRLTIAPEYREITIVSPGNLTFETGVTLYNKFMCEASCKYTLKDLSNNMIMDTGTFSSEVIDTEHYSKEIRLEYNGYGTNLYLYTVECMNNRTAVCPANQNVIIRKSLMAVSYVPSEEQSSSVEYLKEKYSSISQNLASSSMDIMESGKLLDAVNFPFDRKDYASLDAEEKSLNYVINKTLDIWRTDDYMLAKSYLDIENISARSQSLFENSASYKNYLYQSLYNHNFLVEEFWKYYPLLELYTAVLSIDSDLSYLNDSEQAALLRFILNGNSVIDALNSEIYNFTILSEDASELKGEVAGLDNSILHSANYGLMENYAPIYVYSKILCMLENDSSDINESSYIDSELCLEDFDIYPKNVSDILEKFKNLCSITSGIQLGFEYLEQSENQKDSEETLLLQYKLLSDYESRITQDALAHGNTSSNGADDTDILATSAVLPIYKNYIANVLIDEYNITDINSTIVGFDFEPSNITLGRNNLLYSDISDIANSCNSDPEIRVPKISNMTAKSHFIPTVEIPAITAVAAPVAIPKCCIYGKCQSCEMHNKKNPLVMLHGHSLNKEVDAYRSIESFNEFEYAFMDDKLYFLTGMMTGEAESSEGIFGRYSVPVAIKPTYYLEVYNDLLGLTVSESKNDNIDTYALRLKQSIDYTLYLTGNDKVDIVAHSMGGLVVRRYIQIFGSKNVGTVILIGTPNKGVNENIYNLCKIFGAEAECTDMRSDSLFIKKLNDPTNQPDMSKMYLVIGKGCETLGIDGDGVVTSDSVKIEGIPESNILYVDGNCNEIGGFHRQLLDVDEHPDVYAFVKEKLGQDTN
jgi:hypothetical protein